MTTDDTHDSSSRALDDDLMDWAEAVTNQSELEVNAEDVNDTSINDTSNTTSNDVSYMTQDTTFSGTSSTVNPASSFEGRSHYSEATNPSKEPARTPDLALSQETYGGTTEKPYEARRSQIFDESIDPDDDVSPVPEIEPSRPTSGYGSYMPDVMPLYLEEGFGFHPSDVRHQEARAQWDLGGRKKASIPCVPCQKASKECWYTTLPKNPGKPNQHFIDSCINCTMQGRSGGQCCVKTINASPPPDGGPRFRGMAETQPIHRSYGFIAGTLAHTDFSPGPALGSSQSFPEGIVDGKTSKTSSNVSETNASSIALFFDPTAMMTDPTVLHKDFALPAAIQSKHRNEHKPLVDYSDSDSDDMAGPPLGYQPFIADDNDDIHMDDDHVMQEAILESLKQEKSDDDSNSVSNNVVTRRTPHRSSPAITQAAIYNSKTKRLTEPVVNKEPMDYQTTDDDRPLIPSKRSRQSRSIRRRSTSSLFVKQVTPSPPPTSRNGMAIKEEEHEVVEISDDEDPPVSSHDHHQHRDLEPEDLAGTLHSHQSLNSRIGKSLAARGKGEPRSGRHVIPYIVEVNSYPMPRYMHSIEVKDVNDQKALDYWNSSLCIPALTSCTPCRRYGVECFTRQDKLQCLMCTKAANEHCDIDKSAGTKRKHPALELTDEDEELNCEKRELPQYLHKIDPEADYHRRAFKMWNDDACVVAQIPCDFCVNIGITCYTSGSGKCVRCTKSGFISQRCNVDSLRESMTEKAVIEAGLPLHEKRRWKRVHKEPDPYLKPRKWIHCLICKLRKVRGNFFREGVERTLAKHKQLGCNDCHEDGRVPIKDKNQLHRLDKGTPSTVRRDYESRSQSVKYLEMLLQHRKIPLPERTSRAKIGKKELIDALLLHARLLTGQPSSAIQHEKDKSPKTEEQVALNDASPTSARKPDGKSRKVDPDTSSGMNDSVNLGRGERLKPKAQTSTSQVSNIVTQQSYQESEYEADETTGDLTNDNTLIATIAAKKSSKSIQNDHFPPRSITPNPHPNDASASSQRDKLRMLENSNTSASPRGELTKSRQPKSTVNATGKSSKVKKEKRRSGLDAELEDLRELGGKNAILDGSVKRAVGPPVNVLVLDSDSDHSLYQPDTHRPTKQRKRAVIEDQTCDNTTGSHLLKREEDTLTAEADSATGYRKDNVTSSLGNDISVNSIADDALEDDNLIYLSSDDDDDMLPERQDYISCGLCGTSTSTCTPFNKEIQTRNSTFLACDRCYGDYDRNRGVRQCKKCKTIRTPQEFVRITGTRRVTRLSIPYCRYCQDLQSIKASDRATQEIEKQTARNLAASFERRQKEFDEDLARERLKEKNEREQYMKQLNALDKHDIDYFSTVRSHYEHKKLPYLRELCLYRGIKQFANAGASKRILIDRILIRANAEAAATLDWSPMVSEKARKRVTDMPTMVLGVARLSSSSSTMNSFMLGLVAEDRVRATVNFLSKTYWRDQTPKHIHSFGFIGCANLDVPIHSESVVSGVEGQIEELPDKQRFAAMLRQTTEPVRVMIISIGFTGISVSISGWVKLMQEFKHLDITLLITEQEANIPLDMRDAWPSSVQTGRCRRVLTAVKLKVLVQVSRRLAQDPTCQGIIEQWERSFRARVNISEAMEEEGLDLRAYRNS